MWTASTEGASEVPIRGKFGSFENTNFTTMIYKYWDINHKFRRSNTKTLIPGLTAVSLWFLFYREPPILRRYVVFLLCNKSMFHLTRPVARCKNTLYILRGNLERTSSFENTNFTTMIYKSLSNFPTTNSGLLNSPKTQMINGIMLVVFPCSFVYVSLWRCNLETTDWIVVPGAWVPDPPNADGCTPVAFRGLGFGKVKALLRKPRHQHLFVGDPLNSVG